MTGLQGSLFDQPDEPEPVAVTEPQPEGEPEPRPEPESDPVAVADLLQPWRDTGVLSAADVHIAATLARLGGLGTVADGARLLAPDEAEVVLGIALAARAPRLGHVCLDLGTVRQSVPAEVEGDADEVAAAAIDALPWPPDIESWQRVLAASALVSVVVGGHMPAAVSGRGVPLVLDGTLLYLERYRVYEDHVAAELQRRAGASAGGSSLSVAASAFAGVFESSDEQRDAAEAGAGGLLSVIVGGPGTGKTTTVATMLALLLEAEPALRIALVAPTGKAAARMGESITALAATLRESGVDGAGAQAERLASAEVSTIHRRLGWRPDSTFRHDHDNPLVHDVVIVDETSMVSLPLMAHLLDAIRPDARLVLVGDPGQLASVEAGSVLGDIAGPSVDAALAGAPAPVGPLGGCVSVLAQSYRFPAGSSVGRFAAAVRAGDADAALAVLADAGPAGSAAATGVELRWQASDADSDAGGSAVRDAALDGARRTLAAALAGDAVAALDALGEVRVLCAHRRGPFGVAWWNWRFEEWLAGDGPRLGGSYVGRPVMVTANDPLNGVANGDLGVVVAAEPAPRVAFPEAAGPRLVAPSRLESLDTVHAMTIHKSQGSEFDEIVVILPPAESRLATRELLYTAVTRARRVVTLVGGEAALRRAIANRVVRQTGLRRRLWPDAD
jgi:exodeoxyribonuclease V alpha subunit